jgi:hypothetical protein
MIRDGFFGFLFLVGDTLLIPRCLIFVFWRTASNTDKYTVMSVTGLSDFGGMSLG